jgi:hypothetical protein
MQAEHPQCVLTLQQQLRCAPPTPGRCHPDTCQGQHDTALSLLDTSLPLPTTRRPHPPCTRQVRAEADCVFCLQTRTLPLLLLAPGRGAGRRLLVVAVPGVTVLPNAPVGAARVVLGVSQRLNSCLEGRVTDLRVCVAAAGDRSSRRQRAGDSSSSSNRRQWQRAEVSGRWDVGD